MIAPMVSLLPMNCRISKDWPFFIIVVFVVTSAFSCSVMGRGAIQKSWTEEDRCRVLFNWAGRFEQEFPSAFFTPSVGKRFIARGGFNAKIPNLYRDEYFVPVFGTRFDELSQPQRVQLFRSYVTPCQARAYPEAQTYAELIQGLAYSGVVTSNEIERSVISDRLRAQWKERVLADVKTLPPSEESYAKVEAWAKEGARDLADFWPSEQKAFFTALDAGRKRIGEVALVARMDRLVTGAPTYQNLLALENLINGNSDLYATVSSATAKAQRERGQKALDAGLKTLLNDERVRFDARGQGLVALENGAVWHAEFDKSYLEKFVMNPPIHDLETYARTNRSRDIERAQGLLETAISEAQTEQDVTAIIRRYVGLDIDQPQRQKLQAFAATRIDFLRFDKERWKYSAREIALMTRPAEVSVPARYEPPTAEEIGLAILRSYVENGAEWINKSTVKPSISRMIKLAPVSLTVNSVDLIGCSTFTSTGYHCRYRPALHMGVVDGGSGRRPQDPVGDLFLGVFEGMQRLEKPEVTEEQFSLTSKGWRSSSLEEKVRMRTWPWDIFLAR